MALPANTIWEVRPSVGTDTNGGGFVLGASGTDYSKQDSAQYSFSDLTSVSSLVISSTSHNFVATDVGNLIHINSGTGFTAGFYQIVSVGSNQATLDRSPGTVGVSGVYSVGGALATISNTITNKTQGNTIYVKASGSYIVTVTQNLVAGDGGTGNTATTFIGYTTTRGDNGRVTWTTSTNSVDLITFAVANNFAFYNFAFTCTAGTKGNGLTAGTSGANGNLQLYNCSFDGFNIAINGPFVGSFSWIPLMMFGGFIKNSTSHGILNGYNVVLRGVYIHDNGGDGIRFNNTGDNQQSAVIENCVIYNNTGLGINYDSGTSGANQFVLVSGCAIVSNGSDGCRLDGASASGFYYVNCIFYNNGGYGINTNAAMHIFMLGCAFRLNSSGKYPTGVKDTSAQGEIILTASPFTSIGSDWTLNNTAGGGAACKGAGFPSTIA